MTGKPAWPGVSYPLGASYDGVGTNFALYSAIAEQVELCLFEDRDGTGEPAEERGRLHEVDGLIWHGYLPGIRPGPRYGYLERGPYGTYAGLAHPAIIDYLLDLGVTAIELMPVHQFVSDGFLAERGLSNYWGYNTIGFFAPHNAYSAGGHLGEQVPEFKSMVRALHEAGI